MVFDPRSEVTVFKRSSNRQRVREDVRHGRRMNEATARHCSTERAPSRPLPALPRPVYRVESNEGPCPRKWTVFATIERRTCFSEQVARHFPTFERGPRAHRAARGGRRWSDRRGVTDRDKRKERETPAPVDVIRSRRRIIRYLYSLGTPLRIEGDLTTRQTNHRSRGTRLMGQGQTATYACLSLARSAADLCLTAAGKSQEMSRCQR